ncbi:MAG: hypothetical protein LC800_09660, partial [Acidobacteria bacterium]|nr:hypothetical protein [Acidobacteriota bacterium]
MRQWGESPRWRWGVGAGLLMAALALVPQVHLRAARGGEWRGQYASFQPDETAYSAYVNALIGGRPRRSDPYTGRDDALGAARTETLFSIQFLPAYALALPARLLGLSASTVFIILSPLAAFASTLALFWLLLCATRDARFAAAAALAVLCLGGFATGHKLLHLLAGVPVSHTPLPFLRRYVPAAPFPFFFLFCAFAWRALAARATTTRGALASTLPAALCFAALVYSYFYLWTAALAWVICLALVRLAAPGGARSRALKTLAALAALSAVTLAPYFVLLARRAPALDTSQGLVFTRAPDLLQVSELAGLATLAALYVCARRGRLSLGDPPALLAASFALLPFVVFNQQLLTGCALQPLHYELFVTNYCWSLAALLTLRLARRGGKTDDAHDRSSPDARAARAGSAAAFSPRALAFIAAAAFAVGAFESVAATRLTARRNLLLDGARPPLLRLAEIARADPGAARATVFYEDFRQADLAPTVAPQPTLWALHTFSFNGVTREEERERLYQQLYFSGFGEADFLRLLERRTFLLSAVFGWTRALEGWDAHLAPVSRDEMLAETRAYSDYAATFTRARAELLPLGFIVVPAAGRAQSLANLDRFYERDAGERAGDYVVHRVK